MISNQEREEVAKRWKASTAQIYKQEADDIRSITSKHATRNTIRSGIFLQELLKTRIRTIEKVAEMRTDAWIKTLSKRTKPIPPEDKQEVVEDVKQIISSRCETVERAVMEKAKQILGRKSDQLEGWKRQVEQECSRLLTRFKSEVECRIMDLNSSIQERRRWKTTFQDDLNRIFREEGLPYVMVDGKIRPTGIAFVVSEIVAKADELLEEHGIKGALEELRKACKDFVRNNFKETILKANHALESVRKAILGVEKMKPGEQCKKVIEEVVPEHFEGFQVLLKKIMDATDALRHNAPGAGHGQGKKLRQVSPQLAELALHLNSALIIYLLSEWRAKTAPDTTA